MAKIIGIDPGTSTGMAMLQDGRIVWLDTVAHDMIERVLWHGQPHIVAIEDSRLQPVFHRAGVGGRAMLKIAANVGEINALCKQIEAIVSRMPGVQFVAVSPLAKGAKLNAEGFRDLTGWALRSNQHERDACMVAWPMRRAV